MNRYWRNKIVWYRLIIIPGRIKLKYTNYYWRKSTDNPKDNSKKAFYIISIQLFKRNIYAISHFLKSTVKFIIDYNLLMGEILEI